MSTESDSGQSGLHSAEASALGFYYQSLFALKTLLELDSDNAAVAIERLDDVEVVADKQTLLLQLKHSLSATPAPITLASRALWKTLKAWIDTLPKLSIAETVLHLVAVGHVPAGSPLLALLQEGSDREELIDALVAEATRVVEKRAEAKAAKKDLPYADRADGCEALLNLPALGREALVRRIRIHPNSPNIALIESEIAKSLKLLPSEQRALVASRLVAWWDREVIYSLCGQRDRAIAKLEVQAQISSIIGEIESGLLHADFSGAKPPPSHEPDSMLLRQIRLVCGSKTDENKATVEEWRARAQRSKWVEDNPAMASTINRHDEHLCEEWSNRHEQMTEDCQFSGESEKCTKGLALLRWTHEDAPGAVEAIAAKWSAVFYVRGSYQVLAVDKRVGWHPDYIHRLEDDV
ncbi:ABC-three component system protein [Stenotrophomonas sp. TWI1151]|uniref:ABC-three component system protein n=1 Tax=Stenotrophomonas sp. TWI1151 TaxID=3136798 RepID=UPI0032097D03